MSTRTAIINTSKVWNYDLFFTYGIAQRLYYFKRWHKINEDERFAIFVNTISTSEDPHTDYLPAKEKKKFDVNMSGTFYGIGARLKAENDKIKVAEIIVGSPCWKQGELKAEDDIIKVAQGEKEPVDIQGYDIEDAVELIRGEKGTEVRLTVKRIDGSVKVIPIIRDEVKMEEIFAKSAIIKSMEGPIGYIYLPEFYNDFSNANGSKCAEDIAREVQKLKTENVKGIILDLRYNPGGSLSDVVDMSGLFVGKGPIVQVKSGGVSPMTLSANKSMQYDGPLVVMVNQNSASASEILAAAMQDYKRAVIVGAPTYGKGTVQKVLPLDEFVDLPTRLKLQALATSENGGSGQSSLGSLKITMQKFYRVNGGSTQLKGVTPDIIFPDAYSLMNLGERRDKSALEWDVIPPANYKPLNNTININELVAMSKSRIAANPTFTLIQESAKRLKKQEDDNTYSLNETEYRKELKEANETSKKLEEIQKKITPFEMTNPQADLSRINADSATITKNKEWLKNLKKDIYLSETLNIITDMTKGNMKVDLGTGMK